MADRPEHDVSHSSSLEARVGIIEGDISKILGLLNTLASNKEAVEFNGNADQPQKDLSKTSMQNNNKAGEDNHSEDAPADDNADIIIVTPKSHGTTSSRGKGKEQDNAMQIKVELLEEKMRAMQGLDAYGKLDMQDFCLFPDIEIPAKFKVPEFEKFEGKTDPMIHLTMYTRSMAAYHNNEKLMIHCFQHSLVGGALTWFLHLDKHQMRSWRSLAELFIKQYQFVTDIAPDRFELQRIRKAESETFREYAQRWREKASQVQPPLTEKEIVRLFVKTLDGAYFEKLLSCVTNRFADVVLAGEQVEDAIREGKLSGPAGHQEKFKKPNFQKKEADVHMINSSSYPPKNKPHQPTYQPSPYSVSPFYPHHYPTYPPNYPSTCIPGTSQITDLSHFPVNSIAVPNSPPNNHINASHPPQPQPENPKREKITIEPVPFTYAQLYKALLERRLVGPEVPQPIPNPLPKWYNPSETCEYHMEAPGHSIERCLTFKLRVQRLRNAGKLGFKPEEEQSAGPSIESNPLRKHA